MDRIRFGPVALALAVFVGMGAWATGGDPELQPAPVDALLSESSEVVEEAPEVDGANEPSPDASSLEVVSRSADSFAPEPEWDLPVARNDRVDYWIDFLKGRNKDRTHLWLEREGKYGPLIRSALRERGMPEDLLYLTMIESGLSPHAYSHAHAAGLWQFISATGRRYGLEITTYVDERRDPLAATDAALDYLSDLHDQFGSWYLAAAAYNSGEGRVGRILRQRAGGRTGSDALFWQIDGYLPRETRDYVPLMLAAGHIGKDPNGYGFYGLEHQAPLAFEEVEVPGGVRLNAVARAAGVEAEAVEELNPHLVHEITPPGRAWDVRVPVGTADRVAAGLAEATREQKLATVEHRVRRGETLSHLARRYGVSVSALRSANGWVNPRRLQVGQRVQVPTAGGAFTLAASGSASGSQSITYRVRRGDTLWEIARRHGVSVGQLRSWNGIGSRIHPGQRIRIDA